MMYPEANREICGMGKTEKENYMEYGGFAKDQTTGIWELLFITRASSEICLRRAMREADRRNHQEQKDYDLHSIRIRYRVVTVEACGWAQSEAGAMALASAADFMQTDAADTPIEELGLSTRSFSALQRVGICTVGDLVCQPWQSLSGIRNIGRRSLEEIIGAVQDYVPGWVPEGKNL